MSRRGCGISIDACSLCNTVVKFACNVCLSFGSPLLFGLWPHPPPSARSKLIRFSIGLATDDNLSTASSLRIPAGLKIASSKSRLQILVRHCLRLVCIAGFTASYATAFFRELGLGAAGRVRFRSSGLQMSQQGSVGTCNFGILSYGSTRSRNFKNFHQVPRDKA